MQELIWLIVHDFDTAKAKNEITDRRFPLLEGFEFVQKFYGDQNVKTFEDLKRPRT